MIRIAFQRSQNFELGLVSRYSIAILLPAVALWLSLVFEISFGNPFWFLFSKRGDSFAENLRDG